jgi:hypothetical protein
MPSETQGDLSQTVGALMNAPQEFSNHIVTPTVKVPNTQQPRKLPPTRQWEVAALPSQPEPAAAEGRAKSILETTRPSLKHSSASQGTVVVDEAIREEGKDSIVVESKPSVKGKRGRAKKANVTVEKGESSIVKAKTPRKRKQDNGEGSSGTTPAKTPRKRKQRADEPPAASKRPRSAVKKTATPISPPNDNMSFPDESQSSHSVSNVGLTPASQSSSVANFGFPPAPQEAMSEILSLAQDYSTRQEQQERFQQTPPQQFQGSRGAPPQEFESSIRRPNSEMNQTQFLTPGFGEDRGAPRQLRQPEQVQFQGDPVDSVYAQYLQQQAQLRQLQFSGNPYAFGYNTLGYQHHFPPSERARRNMAAMMHNEALARAQQAAYQTLAMGGYDMSAMVQPQQQNHNFGPQMVANANFAIDYASFSGYPPNIQAEPRRPGRGQSNVGRHGYHAYQTARPSDPGRSNNSAMPNQQLGRASGMLRQQAPPVVPSNFGETPTQQASPSGQSGDLLNYISSNDPAYTQHMYHNREMGQRQPAPSPKEENIDPSLYGSEYLS